MSRLVRLFRTSIGSKLVMALSGLALVLFLLGHMLGNLIVFQGREALNAYAAWLQGHPLLWVFRLTMVVVFGLHIFTGVRLARENRAARLQPYFVSTAVESGFAERYMLISGLLVFAFVIYHLLHLTVGAVAAVHFDVLDAEGRPDVYSRVVAGFSSPWIAASYLAFLGVLGMHLQHAVRSLFQTLGFNHESYQSLIVGFSAVFPALLVAGFASIPIAVLLGWVGMGEVG